MDRDIEQLEQFPHTSALLFHAASALVDGHFGNKIGEAMRFQESDSGSVLSLLLFQWARSPHAPKLEICDKNEMPDLKKMDLHSLEKIILRGELSAKEARAKEKIDALARTLASLPLQHLFQRFVALCLDPSYLTVQQWLRCNDVQKAIAITFGLKNRSKALELIIDHLLTESNPEKAIDLWHQLATKQERARMAAKISEAYLSHNQLEKAVAFALSLADREEGENLLREIAIQLMKNQALEQAQAVIQKIQEAEIRDFAKSNVVHLLARQQQFNQAKEMALSIQDRDYREDAVLDIIRAYLQIRHLDEAVQFADSLKPGEKEKPSKVIHAALKAHHQDEKIRQLRKLFSFLLTPMRRAA